MQTTEKIWFNGKFLPWQDAQVHVLSHTLHYGGGAFEGIRFYKTPKGPAIFRLQDHVERLLYSARALRLSLPYTAEEIGNIIQEVVRVNQLEEGYVRPIAFYGYGKMGVNPIGSSVNFAVACWPWGAYLPHDTVNVKTSNYIRIHPASTIVDAKLCGHYLNGILASLELQGTHYQEALFLDDQGHLSEGVGENFFMVRDQVIYTPKLGSILAGITRDTVIQMAARLGYQVRQTQLRLEDAYAANEAFFTGTAAEVTAIHSIDDRVIGDGQEGPVTARVKKAYLELVRGKSEEFGHYLTRVA
jgi:branched-chain amino acid aminotransferase